MGKLTDNTNSNQINEICRISKGTFIEGTVKTQSDIRVDGEISGNLYTQGRLVLGETGIVRGMAVCQHIDAWGEIDGKIYVSDTASLKSACRFKGELHTGKLSVELGARYDGLCRMIEKQEFDKVAAPFRAQKPAEEPGKHNK